MTTAKLITYGTLKKNHYNHHYLRNAKLLGETTLPEWSMVNAGRFPIAFPAKGKHIEVEVYEVPLEDMPNIDILEGYPFLYDKRKVPTAFGPAYIYFMNADSHAIINLLQHKGEMTKW